MFNNNKLTIALHYEQVKDNNFLPVMYILLCNRTSYFLQAVFAMCRQKEFEQAEEVFTRIWQKCATDDTSQDEVLKTTIKIVNIFFMAPRMVYCSII